MDFKDARLDNGAPGTDVDSCLQLAKMTVLTRFLGGPKTMLALSHSLDQLTSSGYTMLDSIFAYRETSSVAGRLSTTLQQCDDPSVLRSRGKVYGSRNLIATFPAVLEIPKHPRLARFITTVLGMDAGMVRALFFDKSPDRSWSLPWHRDRTIAVKCNEMPTQLFGKPTVKAGVPHVEAPESLLENMLTLRVHLDAMVPENGPLSVIPRSHLLDQEADQPPVAIRADVGDVLAMRPLLLHSSSNSQQGNNMHRRVIHLEFASCVQLPDNYEWYSFNPIV